jgi:hypothetical protein
MTMAYPFPVSLLEVVLGRGCVTRIVVCASRRLNRTLLNIHLFAPESNRLLSAIKTEA